MFQIHLVIFIVCLYLKYILSVFCNFKQGFRLQIHFETTNDAGTKCTPVMAARKPGLSGGVNIR